MKSWGMLIGGAVVGATAAYYFTNKTRVPNAYALGQANPTTPYQNLTSAQLAQLNTSPPLPSPPPLSTLAGSAVPGITQAMGGTGYLRRVG